MENTGQESAFAFTEESFPADPYRQIQLLDFQISLYFGMNIDPRAS
jgi:hypothetical protein